MRAISYVIVEQAINDFNPEIIKFKTQIKNNLEELAKKKLKPVEKTYVEYLLQVSDEIIQADPDALSVYQAEFDKIIPPEQMEDDKLKNFRDKILDALGYAVKRKDFYPKYFYKIGVKACVYCNAHLTVAIQKMEQLKTKEKEIFKAKFQVDHYLAKSKYPCFSISLYNLYPVCGSCNNCKSSQNLNFRLYSDPAKISSSPFEFKLKKGTVARYLLSRNIDDIDYSFHEPAVSKEYKTFQEVLDIQGIYYTQKDLAEELILRAEVYTDQYKKTLKNQYPRLFTSSGIFNRVLLGNYTSEEDIHKRPMAKFTRDIAKQIGLIKKE